LWVSNTNITSLPEGLEVGGDLFLQDTTIKSLPAGLKVGGDLYLKDSSLNELTTPNLKKMIQPGFIKGKIQRRAYIDYLEYNWRKKKK
jgi:ABC-type uncharacterized transport system YnjBCD ATPase subunit